MAQQCTWRTFEADQAIISRDADDHNVYLIVSGRVRALFERHELEVEDDPPIPVPAFRCRWCGFPAVTDTPDDIPDHSCSGPPARTTARNVPPPPFSHAQP